MLGAVRWREWKVGGEEMTDELRERRGELAVGYCFFAFFFGSFF